MRFFISGHIDLTLREFIDHYVPQIDRYLKSDLKPIFVIGDAAGCDTMAQAYLKDKSVKVIVYHMLVEPRNNSWGYPTIGGFLTDTDRDSAMTQDSDIDIAWVRPGREKSGTAKNLARRSLSVDT